LLCPEYITGDEPDTKILDFRLKIILFGCGNEYQFIFTLYEKFGEAVYSSLHNFFLHYRLPINRTYIIFYIFLSEFKATLFRKEMRFNIIYTTAVLFGAQCS
jgi:hypothetical protein